MKKKREIRKRKIEDVRCQGKRRERKKERLKHEKERKWIFFFFFFFLVRKGNVSELFMLENHFIYFTLEAPF